MVTCTKVKQKPKDGCVHTLQFSAEKALKACDHTRMDKLADIFDPLSALNGLGDTGEYLYIFRVDKAILTC